MPVVKKDPTFGDRLARYMAEKDMTAADLAREVWGTMTDERGYTVPRNRQSIGKYMRGKSAPTNEVKRKLAEALGVPYTTLFPNEDLSDVPGSGVTLEPVNNKESRLTLNVTLPTAVAAKIIHTISEYVK